MARRYDKDVLFLKKADKENCQNALFIGVLWNMKQ